MVALRQLSAGEKRALARLDVGTWKRKLGGWAQPGVPDISLAISDVLINMGLARKAGDCLQITEYGRVVLDKVTTKQKATS